MENPSVLPNLAVLRALRNELSGTLPARLLLATRLVELSLGQNRITGGIDHLIYPNQSMITSIDLSANNISGTIPVAMTRLSRLRSLQLAKNRISGTLDV